MQSSALFTKYLLNCSANKVAAPRQRALLLVSLAKAGLARLWARSGDQRQPVALAGECPLLPGEGEHSLKMMGIAAEGEVAHTPLSCTLSRLLSLCLDCVSGPCPFGEVHLHPAALPRLNRTFVWDVKASTKAGLELKFSAPWLRQIEPGETCPDFVSYNINSCIDTATVNIGTFCRDGLVSRIKLLGGVVMSLHLPWDSPLTTSGFSIANRASIKREFRAGVPHLQPPHAGCSRII